MYRAQLIEYTFQEDQKQQTEQRLYFAVLTNSTTGMTFFPCEYR